MNRPPVIDGIDGPTSGVVGGPGIVKTIRAHDPDAESEVITGRVVSSGGLEGTLTQTIMWEDPMTFEILVPAGSPTVVVQDPNDPSSFTLSR